MITDAGPLVAYFDRDSAHHDWVRDRFDRDFRVDRRNGRQTIPLISPS